MALWTPAEITTALWLDASDSTTITLDGGVVSQWADKSGNNKHATQSTATNRPTVATASIDGKDAISFDGIDNYLETPSITLNCPTSLFLVAKTTTFSGDRGLINVQASASEVCPWQHYFNATNNRLIDWRTGALVSGLVANTPFLLSEIQSATNVVDMWASGNAGTRGTNGTGYAPTRAVSLGRNQASGAIGWFSGQIAAVIIVASAVDTDTRQKIEGYLAWHWGMEATLPSGHPYKLAAPETGGSVLVATLEQPYGDVPFLDAALHQPYSLLLETWLQQIYGDVPELAAAMHQPYSDAAVLNRSLLQPWADALQMQVDLDQPFALPESLQVAVEQRWGIVAAVLEATCEQLFHIEQNTTLFAGLCQPYAMLGEAARLHSLSTKLYVGGVRIPYVSLEWQATDSEFFWYCAFSVKSRAVADLCADGAAIRIEHMGEEYHLKCYGGWLLDKRHAEETYRVEGYSRTRDLDEATPLRQDFAGGLASQIVADLAAPFSIAVNWQMVDGWIAEGKLTANDETPLAVIRNIVADMGGIVQSTPAGDLLIIAEEEIAIPDYPSASPAATINASLERISTSEQKDEQKGYNKFVVSDQAAAGGQFALDYIEIDATTRELRLFVVPLEGRQFTLTSSGGSEVTIEPVGVVDLPIVDELVEFVAGSGRTQRPIHGISAQAWQRDNLGAITASEEGVLTSATPGYSLLKISYVSRYHKWIGRDSNIEDVQFIATEVLP